jgi:hypothetical protein
MQLLLKFLAKYRTPLEWHLPFQKIWFLLFPKLTTWKQIKNVRRHLLALSLRSASSTGKNSGVCTCWWSPLWREVIPKRQVHYISYYRFILTVFWLGLMMFMNFSIS